MCTRGGGRRWEAGGQLGQAAIATEGDGVQQLVVAAAAAAEAGGNAAAAAAAAAAAQPPPGRPPAHCPPGAQHAAPARAALWGARMAVAVHMLGPQVRSLPPSPPLDVRSLCSEDLMPVGVPWAACGWCVRSLDQQAGF